MRRTNTTIQPSVELSFWPSQFVYDWIRADADRVAWVQALQRDVPDIPIQYPLTLSAWVGSQLEPTVHDHLLWSTLMVSLTVDVQWPEIVAALTDPGSLPSPRSTRQGTKRPHNKPL